VARRVTTWAAAVVVALVLAVQSEGATLTQSESSLLSAMNAARRGYGLGPLRADGRLERAARGHSARMLRLGVFFHGAFTARIRRAGVRAPRLGENLAWAVGRVTRARSIVTMWLASPPHRANLLYPGYRLVGVGAINGNFGGQRNARMITTDFAGY
jgi:uncharacterized protein YkwD